MPIIFTLLFIAITIQLIDYCYHLKEVKAIRLLPPVKTVRQAKILLKPFRPKPFDALLGPLQMLAAWLMMIAAILAAWKAQRFWIDLCVIWIIASQLRRLEELSHMAIHGSLGGPRKLAFCCADLFFQLPLLKPDAITRQFRHCVLHHPNVNLKAKDPGLHDFIEIGFIPGITQIKFWLCLFYYFTPQGLASRIKGILSHLQSDFSHPPRLFARWATMACTTLPFLIAGWWYGFLMFYLLPVLIVFPQFYWISQIVEHRWFEEVESLDPISREMKSCRRTDYTGFLGQFIAVSFFPVGDRFHMAHSLFPPLRWNYLPAIDALMKRSLSEYSANESNQLFFESNGQPSAISHLKQIMLKKENQYDEYCRAQRG